MGSENLITTQDIINAVAKDIKDKIKAKIFIDEDEQQKYIDTNDCIFINATFISSEVATLNTNVDDVIIDISYFPQYKTNKIALYEVEKTLRGIFTRSIKIGENYIHIFSTSADYIKDSVGWRLNFSIRTKFHNLMFSSTTENNTKKSGMDNIEIFDIKNKMEDIIIN